jgi:acyl carrier protein
VSTVVDKGTSLFDDLQFDSLAAFELLILTETLADAIVPPPDVPEIYSLGEAYEYYRQLCELADTQWGA